MSFWMGYMLSKQNLIIIILRSRYSFKDFLYGFVELLVKPYIAFKNISFDYCDYD